MFLMGNSFWKREAQSAQGMLVFVACVSGLLLVGSETHGTGKGGAMLRDNLKQLREKRGWTQEELAQRLHVVR